MSLPETAFYRFAFGLPPLLVWIVLTRNFGAWRTTRPLAHLWRGTLGLSTMVVAFTAVRLLPLAEADPTVRALATAELLLERHGVVTRGSVVSESVRGGFALVYKVLSGFEESGRARRGYFVEGLGGAQFATGPTVDRLRSFSREPGASGGDTAVTLAATDPANPFGAALPWPSNHVRRSP